MPVPLQRANVVTVAQIPDGNVILAFLHETVAIDAEQKMAVELHPFAAITLDPRLCAEVHKMLGDALAKIKVKK